MLMAISITKEGETHPISRNHQHHPFLEDKINRLFPQAVKMCRLHTKVQLSNLV
jgi:hypothetical protein